MLNKFLRKKAQSKTPEEAKDPKPSGNTGRPKPHHPPANKTLVEATEMLSDGKISA